MTPAARDPAALVEGTLAGQRASVARLITLVESGGEAARQAISRLFPHTGSAYTVGITGAPGSGKSTLTDRLIARLRRDDVEVGVLAVDPSSPFSGGAILGDRVRMQRRATDPDVFIRSMGTRGHLGGLARATHDAVRVLEAMGKDLVLVETVGVGQGEVDVVRTADTVVVVTAPGLGDEVQAIKAGIMEIGDVFVINKSDREGADRATAELESMLQMGEEVQRARGEGKAWRPPVLRVSAEQGQGIAELQQALREHRAWQEASGALAERRRRAREAEVL
ncbi:MAG: methylmalonyl Co-A mutase-associated GTPase MeaB, partial [Acidimicrobiia bacterium]